MSCFTVERTVFLYCEVLNGWISKNGMKFYGVLKGVASLLQINSESSCGEVHSSLLNGVASEDDAT